MYITRSHHDQESFDNCPSALQNEDLLANKVGLGQSRKLGPVSSETQVAYPPMLLGWCHTSYWEFLKNEIPVLTSVLKGSAHRINYHMIPNLWSHFRLFTHPTKRESTTLEKSRCKNQTGQKVRLHSKCTGIHHINRITITESQSKPK